MGDLGGAVVWATTLCRPYLRAVHFELITDSNVVAALLTNDTSSSRRQNFLLRMAEYNFTAVHRKGELNRNADFFSRWARYKEYEDHQRAIPPVINMIIQDEVQSIELEEARAVAAPCEREGKQHSEQHCECKHGQ